jgi:hypothetical protein
MDKIGCEAREKENENIVEALLHMLTLLLM